MKRNTERLQGIHEWMLGMWEDMPQPRRCKSCNTRIYGAFKSMYFDHLLDKSKYPEYDVKESNIYFCCAQCHWLKNNGFPTEKHLAEMKKALDLHKQGKL